MGFPLKRRGRRRPNPTAQEAIRCTKVIAGDVLGGVVFAVEQGIENGKLVERPADAAFDLVLAC